MAKRIIGNLPAIVAFLVGTAAFTATWLPARHLPFALTIWSACLGAALAVIAAGVFLIARGTGRPLSFWRSCLPSVFLVIAGFAYLLIIESALGSYLLAAIVALLVGAHLAQVRSAAAGVVERDPALAHLANLIGLAGLFLLLSFLYGINSYYYVSMPLLGLAAAAAVAGVAGESLASFGLTSAELPIVVVVFGALEFQAYVGFSFLPTGNLVNAAVNVILFASSLYAVRMILQGAVEARHFRRELALSFLSVAILMATAGWF